MIGISILPSKINPERSADCIASTLPSVRGATPFGPTGLMLRAPDVDSGQERSCVLARKTLRSCGATVPP